MRIWDAARFRPIGEPMRHHGAIRHVAFSPDGTRLADAELRQDRAVVGPAYRLHKIGTAIEPWRLMSGACDSVMTANAARDGQLRRDGPDLERPHRQPAWVNRMNHGDMVYDAVWSDDSSRRAHVWAIGVGPAVGCRQLAASGRTALAPRPGRRGALPARQARCRHLLARRHGQALDRAREPITTPAEQAVLEANVTTGMELGDDDIVAAAGCLDLAIAPRRARGAASDPGVLSTSDGDRRRNPLTIAEKVYKRIVPDTLTGMGEGSRNRIHG